MNRPRQDSNSAGFSLSEMLIVFASALLLLLLSYPPLFKMYIRSQLEGSAGEAAIAMQRARFQAIRTGQQALVCVHEAERTITANVGATLLTQLALPAAVSIAGPGSEPGITVAGSCLTFLTDGSVAATGAFRLADPRGNFLEIRVEPQATARVQVRKWNDADGKWYTRDQGAKPWEWRT